MALFTGDIVGVDLGSSYTSVFLSGEGVALREPSKVLTLTGDTQSVLSVGLEAQAMLGRTPGDVTLHSPVLDGAVADIDLAALLMLALAEKAQGRRKPMEKARFAVSMSQGLTKVEKDALMRAAQLTGSKRPILARTPLAAALGAGLNVDAPKGVMLVLLGGGTTEIAILAMNGIVASRSMRTAGFSMDEAIVRYVRKEKGLIIGPRTAEDLKCDIGSATEPEDGDGETVLLKGKHLSTGKPETTTITTKDIAKALAPSVELLVDAMRDALSRTPPELMADIQDGGIYLTGGGARLPGLGQLLACETDIPFTVSEHPQDDVALGLGRLCEDERLLKMALEVGSAEE